MKYEKEGVRVRGGEKFVNANVMIYDTNLYARTSVVCMRVVGDENISLLSD
jgi:hypothetical protein